MTNKIPFNPVAMLFVAVLTLNLARAQVIVYPGGTNYTNVNAAFAAINSGLHTGSLAIAISANTNEPATPTPLNASGVGAASYSSVIISPIVSGVTISGKPNPSRAVLEFDGADSITINGNLNNGTGSSRNLTIQNNSASTHANAVLWFKSSLTIPQLGCWNINVRNVKIMGNADVSPTRTGATPYQPLVVFSGANFPGPTSQTAIANNNISFNNNEFLRGQVGLHIGNMSISALTGLSITNNIFGSTTAANFVTWRAMYLYNTQGAIVQGNLIQNIKSSIGFSSGAIEIAGSASSSVIVRRNTIRGVWNTNTDGFACAGIWFDGGSNHTAVNNVIFDILGSNAQGVTTSSNAYGIRLSSGTGHCLWYNSVNLYGTVSTGSVSSTSTALGVNSTAVTGLNIRNNIFSNLHVSTVSGYQAFCIRYASGYPFATAGNTVNNNYYSVPFSNTSTTSYFLGGTYDTGVTYSNLAALKLATGQDAQSVPNFNIPAPFMANDNLLIPASTPTALESGGVAIAALGLPNTDFTGTNRPAGSGAAPDIGAYEFNGVSATGCNGLPGNGGTVTALVSSVCVGNSTTLTASGFTSDMGIQYNWQRSQLPSGPFTDISGATAPNSYTTEPLTSHTYFRLRVTCAVTSQSTFSNVLPLAVLDPQLLSTIPASRCGTGTVTLGATVTSGTPIWYANATGGIPLALGTSFTTPVISSSTTYFVTATSGGATQTSSNGVPTAATSTQNGGVIFDLNTNVTINSIQVYSTAAGTATVTLQNSALTTIYTSPAIPIAAGTLGIPQTLHLGWAVPAGTGYRMLVSNTGNALGSHTGSFPAPLGNGVGSIVNGALGAGTSTFNYFVYNINTTSRCEDSTRIPVTATINSIPSITSTVGDTLCASGQATLTATGTTSSIRWYTQPSGGAVQGTGSTFITPLITSTTTYYAAPVSGASSSSGGRLTNVAGSSLSSSPRGIIFTAAQPTTIDSVGFLCAGLASAVTIQLYNSGGTAAIGSPVIINIPANAGTSSVPVLLTFPANIQVPAAGTYRLFVTSVSPTGNVLWHELNGVSGYPYAVGTDLSITSSVNSLTGTASVNTYYYFYRLVIGTSCEGQRVPVVANVNTPPAINLSASSTQICTGDNVQLNVNSPNDPNYTYVWNGILNGASQTVSPSSNTTYTVVATDYTIGNPSSGCVITASVVIAVNRRPTIDATPALTNLCGAGTVQLNVSNTAVLNFTLGGTLPTNSTGSQSPFHRFFEGFRNQYLIRASEITSLGVQPGLINSIRFNVASITGTNGTYNRFNIDVGTTTLNDLSGGFISGVPVRFTATSYIPVLGPNTFNFSTPLNWNGIDNIVVEVCFDNDPNNTCTAGSPTCSGTFCSVNVATSQFTNTTRSYAADNGTISNRNICDTTGLGTLSAVRPVMTFGLLNNLGFSWSPAIGLSNTTIANPVASVPENTSITYTATATNLTTGCTSTDSVKIVTKSNPTPLINTNDTTLCNPAQIYIKVADIGAYSSGYPAGSTFTWKDATGATYFSAADVDSISSTSGSSFYVDVILPSGCFGRSDTAFVLTKAVSVTSNAINATCVGTDGSINVNVVVNAFNGVQPPYNFVWSTDQAQTNIIKNVTKSSTQDTLNNLGAGTYYLQVFDAAGSPASCNSGVIPFTITSPPPIVVTPGTITNVTCNGFGDGAASITFTGGSAPYTFSWSNGDATQNISGLSGGTYTVTVSDNQGCAGNATVTVVEPSALSLTLTSTNASSAIATNGTVTAVASGGTGPYTYDWADEQLNGVGSGSTVTGLDSGLYYCLVTDINNCTNVDLFADSIRVYYNIPLSVTMLMQGFHVGGGVMEPVLSNSGAAGSTLGQCDTVVLELRDAVDYSVVYSTTSIASTSGLATGTLSSELSGGSAYIAVKHRNSIQTWSALPVSITGSGMTYNFTTGAAQAYAGNQADLGGGYYGLYNGDVNQDGFVDLLDQIDVDNDVANFAGGYLPTDLTGNGEVDILDQIILDNNASNFVEAIIPQ